MTRWRGGGRSSGAAGGRSAGGARRRAGALGVAVLLGVSAACATAGPREGPAGPGAGTAVPPIPELRGPLSVEVVYPDSLQRIFARDSNFLHGNVGTGDARLTVDGAPVAVEPNGTFLAWLPVPPAERGDTAHYRLVAEREGEADTLHHPVLLPPGPYDGDGRDVWIDTVSLSDPPVRWMLPEERLDLRVRAAPGLEVWIEAGERSFSLYEQRDGRYEARLGAGRLRAAATGEADRPALGADRPAAGEMGAGSDLRHADPDSPDPLRGSPLDSLSFDVVAAGGPDTVRAGMTYPLRVLDPRLLPVVELREDPDTLQGASEVVIGRTAPNGSYQWRFPTGTRALVDGRRGDRVRARLAPDLHAWIRTRDAILLPAGASPATGAVGDPMVEPLPDRIRIRVPLEARLPTRVEQPDTHTLELTLYGGLSATGSLGYGPGSRRSGSGLVEGLRWEQLPGARYRLTVRLRRPVWGHRTVWEAAERGALLRFDIRRPPEIDPDDPLRDRRVAIDAGHPPAGATGPSGMTEAEANRTIAARLVELLREAGAEPVPIRADTLPLGLYHRRTQAREGGAELFVSIHNNALPDGVRPFGREGTSTYYFHPHARELAEEVQRGMLENMGLRDLGLFWGNLAVARTSWMPAILTEGAFMMMPAHEAALRTPAFREAYARGVLEGLRTFLHRRAER